MEKIKKLTPFSRMLALGLPALTILYLRTQTTAEDLGQYVLQIAQIAILSQFVKMGLPLLMIAPYRDGAKTRILPNYTIADSLYTQIINITVIFICVGWWTNNEEKVIITIIGALAVSIMSIGIQISAARSHTGQALLYEAIHPIIFFAYCVIKENHNVENLIATYVYIYMLISLIWLAREGEITKNRVRPRYISLKASYKQTIITMVVNFQKRIDILLVGLILGPIFAAQYRVATSLASLFSFPLRLATINITKELMTKVSEMRAQSLKYYSHIFPLVTNIIFLIVLAVVYYAQEEYLISSIKQLTDEKVLFVIAIGVLISGSLGSYYIEIGTGNVDWITTSYFIGYFTLYVVIGGGLCYVGHFLGAAIWFSFAQVAFAYTNMKIAKKLRD